MKHQTALITGANGFLGKHLVRHLEADGVQISPLSLRGGDVSNIKRITAALEKAQPDYVFHLAGTALGDSAEDFFRTNVLYAATLLRALREASLDDRPILFVGSGAEYGRIEDDNLPITERTRCRPYNYYGMSKLMQTLTGLSAAETENRRIVIARPFNIIGVGMPDHLALASFARQVADVKKGKRPPIVEAGNLTASRDFIDVEDVVHLYWLLIRKEGAYGEVFNICTGVPRPTGDLLNLLIKASGMSIRVELVQNLHKELDIPVHYGSNEKLHRLIGNFKYTPIEETIQKIAR